MIPRRVPIRSVVVLLAATLWLPEKPAQAQFEGVLEMTTADYSPQPSMGWKIGEAEKNEAIQTLEEQIANLNEEMKGMTGDELAEAKRELQSMHDQLAQLKGPSPGGTEGEAGTKEMTRLFIKRDLLRFDTPKTIFAYRPDQRLVWTADKSDKAYVEMTFEQMEQMAKGFQQLFQGMERRPPETKAEKGSPVNVQRTGQRQKILNYDCELIIIKQGKETTEAWVTPALGNILGTWVKQMEGTFKQFASERETREWFDAFRDLQGFPLKTTTKENGQLTETMEVTKVEPRVLPLSEFDPPAGYAKREMPKMPFEPPQPPRE